MKVIVLLVALIAVCNAAPDLKVRFGINPFGSFFIQVPMSVSQAISKSWLLQTRPPGPLPQLIMYCAKELTLCALYDDNNYVAGLQVGLPTDQYSGAVYDWETLGFVRWNPPSAPTRTFWTLPQYFVDEAYLQIPKEQRLAQRDSSKLLQQDAVWVTGFNGALERISSSLTDIEQSIFTQQACVILMGRHWYYNMTPDMPCSAETLYPWFSMVGSGKLHATGFMLPGKITVPNGEQSYFEAPTAADVQMIVPNGPQCLFDLAANPGVTTMHIYYVDNPYLIHCIGQ